MLKNKKVAVLMGGWNSEKEVSLVSGEAVYQALQTLGYEAIKVNFERNIAATLSEIKPDVVFIALHGQYGEDGRIQGLLDIMGIPYTHSGVLASAICMDKTLTRKLCASVGAIVPQYGFLRKGNPHNAQIIDQIGKPFVLKPNDEGSSVGVEVILADTDFDLKNYKWQYGDQIIIERYIKGRELNVAVVDGKALGVLEVKPKGLFYDYKHKYTKGMTEYTVPAPISAKKYNESMVMAEKFHELVGCRGISRIEFILSADDDQLYFLEINTHPGFTPLSINPQIAKYVGISFEDIVQSLVKSAQCY